MMYVIGYLIMNIDRYPRYHNRYDYSVEDAKRDREENIKKYSRK